MFATLVLSVSLLGSPLPPESFGASGVSGASTPYAHPDRELVDDFPTIVVARWRKAPIVNVDIPDTWLRTTEIEVLEVLKGDLARGLTPVGVTTYLGNGDPAYVPFAAYTSGSRVLYDVPSAQEPTIWFLTPERHPGVNSGKPLPCLTSVRGVQPAELTTFYELLMNKSNRDKTIGAFLDCSTGLASTRALRYIIGDRYLDREHIGGYRFDWRPKYEWPKLLVELSDVVAKRLQTWDPKERAEAAVALATLLGKKSLASLQPLLKDTDQEVRSTARAAIAYARNQPILP